MVINRLFSLLFGGADLVQARGLFRLEISFKNYRVGAAWIALVWTYAASGRDRARWNFRFAAAPENAAPVSFVESDTPLISPDRGVAFPGAAPLCSHQLAIPGRSI